MQSRPTILYELNKVRVSDASYMDVSASGAGGVWMVRTGAYTNIVWWVQWSEEITKDVVTDDNSNGKFTNSDLEMAEVLLQWLAGGYIAPITHETNLERSDNSPACSWATRMSPMSNVEAQLMRSLAL